MGVKIFTTLDFMNDHKIFQSKEIFSFHQKIQAYCGLIVIIFYLYLKVKCWHNFLFLTTPQFVRKLNRLVRPYLCGCLFGCDSVPCGRQKNDFILKNEWFSRIFVGWFMFFYFHVFGVCSIFRIFCVLNCSYKTKLFLFKVDIYFDCLIDIIFHNW